MRIAPGLEPSGGVRLHDRALSPGASTGRALAEPHDGSSPFAKVLAGLSREIDVGEGRVHAALSANGAGRDFGPGELISLQAGVYRYSEVLDLSARLIDHATAAVKTVLQGQ